MAERRQDNPNGRMLFTDLDASRTGRPAAALFDGGTPSPDSGVGRPLASLRDLVSTLDFDFEDDDDTPPPASTPAPAPEPADELKPDAPFRQPELKPEAVRPLPESPLFHNTPAPASRFETWGGYFAGPQDESRTGGLPRVAEADGYAASSDLRGSFSAPRSVSSRQRPPRASAPIIPPPSAIEVNLDDILSSLPASAEAWRGQRLGLDAPRTAPYGGIERIENWYVPPDRSDSTRVIRAGNWYEPPDENAVDFDAPLNPDAFDLGEPDNPAATGSFSSTRIIDIFSDVDLDSVWENKRRGKSGAEAGAPAQPAPPPPRTDTSARRRAQDGSRSGRLRRQREMASTVILPPDEFLGNADEPSAPADDLLRRIPSDTATVDIADLLPEMDEDRPPLDAPDGEPEEAAAPVAGDDDFVEATVTENEEDEAFDPTAHLAEPNAGAGDKKKRQRYSDRMRDAGNPAPETSDPFADAGIADPEAFQAEEGEGGEEDAPASKDDGESGNAVGGGAEGLAGGIVFPDEEYIPGDAKPAAPAAADGEPAAEDDVAAEAAATAPEALAVNPMDVFANMDDLDFSDDAIDDDMKAALADNDDLPAEGGGLDLNLEMALPKRDDVPTSLVGRIWYNVKKKGKKMLPMAFINKAMAVIAWRENWWFYCDMLAAVIASASVAVILSYYLWYR